MTHTDYRDVQYTLLSLLPLGLFRLVTQGGAKLDNVNGGGGGAIDIKVNHAIHIIRCNSVPKLRIKVSPPLFFFFVFFFLPT